MAVDQVGKLPPTRCTPVSTAAAHRVARRTARGMEKTSHAYCRSAPTLPSLPEDEDSASPSTARLASRLRRCHGPDLSSVGHCRDGFSRQPWLPLIDRSSRRQIWSRSLGSAMGAARHRRFTVRPPALPSRAAVVVAPAAVNEDRTAPHRCPSPLEKTHRISTPSSSTVGSGELAAVTTMPCLARRRWVLGQPWLPHVWVMEHHILVLRWSMGRGIPAVCNL
ncbi:hypothetical protein ACLOJK_019477 [Asimina triloba]